jgi:hypothetical protein
MKFKDRSCFSFNGNRRILQAAISRIGASHKPRVELSTRLEPLTALAPDDPKV